MTVAPAEMTGISLSMSFDCTAMTIVSPEITSGCMEISVGCTEIDTSRSYVYIFSVTNIRGQHVNRYMGAYYQGDAKKKLHDDMSLWEQWYEENKCEMTLQKADSTYFKYISSNN